MATICLANLTGEDAVTFCGNAARGDADAKQQLTDLFADWTPPYECFLCGSEFEHQPGTMVVADPAHKRGYLAFGCCIECYSLPELYRFGKARKILRAMYPGFRLSLVPARKLHA